MVHKDHVQLIKKGITPVPIRQIWADFGSGEGAFTLALRDIAGPDVTIYSIDKDASSQKRQKEQFDLQFPDTKIHYLTADFTRPLDLPKLDGIIAANSLHYVKDHVGMLKQLRKYLKKDGKLVVIEYNVDEGNTWVPYPFSFKTFKKLCQESGFVEPKRLAKIPSQFLNEIYAAFASK